VCGVTISAEALARLRESLAGVVERVGSVEELERWLRAQPCIEAVRVVDALIKVEPPQREFVVSFRRDDGATVTKVIDVVLHPDRTLGLAGVHEP
jgi:hypothetical protein